MFTSATPKTEKPKTPENPSYLVVEPNTQGKDYIVGDLHGQLELFNNILALLTPDDRLFITGDLINRGAHGYNIVEKIFEINKEREKHGLPPQIHVCLGNHEKMFLKYFYSNDRHIFHAANGGDWIFNLHAIQKQKMAAFFNKLPYIIKVKGLKSEKDARAKRPFYIVHSELPLPDHVLEENITHNTPLSPESAHHAIWARSDGFKKFPRKKNSPIVYCGHNIFDGFRENNHCCVDVGAYKAHAALLVILQKNMFKETLIVTDSLFEEEFELALSALNNQIQSALREHDKPLGLAKTPTLNLTFMAEKVAETKSKMKARAVINELFQQANELSAEEQKAHDNLDKLPSGDLRNLAYSYDLEFQPLFLRYEDLSTADESKKFFQVKSLYKDLSHRNIALLNRAYQKYALELGDEYINSMREETANIDAERELFKERFLIVNSIINKLIKLERMTSILKVYIDTIKQPDPKPTPEFDLTSTVTSGTTHEDHTEVSEFSESKSVSPRNSPR